MNSLPLLSGLRSNILAIRQTGLLIGIAILRPDSGYAKLPIPFWRSALHHDQFLGTPLVRTGYEDAFVAGLGRWLDTAPQNCCFVKLTKMSADSAIMSAIARQCHREARAFFAVNRHDRAAIAPSDRCNTPAADLLSANRRKSIRKAMRHLEQSGRVHLERLTDERQIPDWTHQFLAMEDTGWKHENGSSILSCASTTALYKAIIQQAFAEQHLQFSRLCLEGVPIAYTLDVGVPPHGYCLKSAFDQRYRKSSPGVLMEYETLKYYLQRGDFTLVDSCSAPDNALLNQLWPDRRVIVDVAISRKGAGYAGLFRCIRTIKALLKPAADR